MKSVLWFTAAYTVGLFVYGVIVDSPLTFVYTGINVLVIGVFLAIDQWAEFDVWVWWGISLVGLGNMLGGVWLVDGEPLYIAAVLGEMRYDKVFHALAGMVFFFVAWDAMKKFAGENPHRGGLLMFTFLVVMGGGAVVEIAELVGSTIFGTNVGDYGNNALDLGANAVGALVGLVVVLWLERDRARD
jgi:hypothetical protein